MSEEVTETMTEEKESKLSAKNISKIYKFVAPLGCLVCFVLMWTGIFKNATVGDIGAAWAIIYGLGAGTIDVNLMLEKFSRK